MIMCRGLLCPLSTLSPEYPQTSCYIVRCLHLQKMPICNSRKLTSSFKSCCRAAVRFGDYAMGLCLARRCGHEASRGQVCFNQIAESHPETDPFIPTRNVDFEYQVFLFMGKIEPTCRIDVVPYEWPAPEHLNILINGSQIPSVRFAITEVFFGCVASDVPLSFRRTSGRFSPCGRSPGAPCR